MSGSVEFPLVVVGAGGAGMIAALRAASLGTEVLLLEKSVRRMCNSELSGGLIQAAGTRYQAALGIEDSPERMWQDVMRKNKGKSDPDIVMMVCRRSADVVHFLADHVDLDLHLDTNVEWYGHTAYRMHATPTEDGSEVVAGLRAAVKQERLITLIDEAGVRGLIQDEAGRITGVRLRRAGEENVGAEAVLLACNGFGGNREMLRRYCPEIAEATYIGSDNNTGDGIRWGEAAGAALDLMGAYQGHAHVNPNFGTRLGGSIPDLGSILVNLDGRRFEHEDQGYSEFGRHILKQPGGVALEVFDQRIFDLAWNTGAFRVAHAAGAITKAETVRELAEHFSIPADALEAEIGAFNAGVLSGDDPLGRKNAKHELVAPFYGSIVTGAITHTQGGLRIDTSCRVLRPDNGMIPGLFAAGGTAAGISGDSADGYMSGNGLIQAFATGLAAAESIVASLEAVAR